VSGLEEFRAARRFLLDHREDYAYAYREFQWPVLEEFNWALEWFDHLGAAGHVCGGGVQDRLRVILF
jgi:acetyl-CoA synthetase